MDSWIDIRRKALQFHAEAVSRAGGDRSAKSLIAAALAIDDLQVEYYKPGTIVNEGVLGFLERASRLINVASNQDPKDEAVVTAHEIGHFKLHQDPRNEVTAATHLLGGDPVESGAARVEGYSPRERKEVQADVFAGEFLCPSDWLREQYIDRTRRPTEIATELGLPLNLVMSQLIRALLLPPIRPAVAAEPGAAVSLDASQQQAATWAGGPLLVDAGPGTGKTRTLVHRIRHLLDTGADPASILALTFSKKAAEEMRERLAVMNPQAAIEMWVGTFHAFGMEVVTKWSEKVGRTSNVRVLDQTGALAVLEENLTRFRLHHYQNLYEPAYDLIHVLRTISRCKDELLAPDAFRAAAEASMKAAKTDEEQEKAEKVVEAAGIYEEYERLLVENDAVDFGDLVMLAGRILAENEDVCTQYRARFKHIVVDEYQDVNRASAHLLRVLAGPETDVWVVADQRQSIYRFRGAEPSNVARFEEEFGGSRSSLAFNYRSHGPVVRAFERFSATMGGGKAMAGSWTASRGDGGEVTLTVTPTVSAEAEAIRAKIEELRDKGVPYREQVVLARTHLTLSRITDVLERLGVPLLYLGDLFERPEIRDLLSLVGLDAEHGGVGLVRVAGFPEYAVARGDALKVIRWAAEQRMSIFDALGNLPSIGGLSEPGRTGLAKLAGHLRGLGFATSPWMLLTTWLFERSDYLLPLLTANDMVSQQKCIAIYHLLKVCAEYVSLRETSRRKFLERVRRIEALNEDTMYRAVASEAADMDAVRVMTIHGSKGLEFRAVHLPAIATRYMPANRQGVRVPPPQSLPHLVMQPEHHDAEEECLFFVALSRARDYREVVKATRSSGSGPSDALEVLERPVTPRACYSELELSVYMDCPARYYYQVEEGLRGGRDSAAYPRFHRCVYATIGWIELERQAGRAVSAEGALAQLVAVWQQSKLFDHPFEAYYRTTAENMVNSMLAAVQSENVRYARAEWSVPVGSHTITVTPDRVLVAADGAVHVQRVRTGRRTKSESDKPIYALLRLGASLAHPGVPVKAETFYLASGERVVASEKNDAKLLEKYTEAINGIECGDFHPETDPRTCPNCQCYFMCGT
jgi:DNA helicase-2/ATP-dependent DNA helicase PcrA